MTLSLFAPPAEVVRPPVQLVRGWAAALSLEQVRASIPWRQYSGEMYGAVYDRPRLECWYNDDPTRTYRFGGGAPIPPHAMEAVVARVRLRLREQGYGDYDSCFANRYRSGADSIAWHADDEAWIGPVIASVSFGATRRFSMKPKPDFDGAPVSYELAHGDLFVMGAGCQDRWLHCVPKTKRYRGERINLTFRTTQQRGLSVRGER